MCMTNRSDLYSSQYLPCLQGRDTVYRTKQRKYHNKHFNSLHPTSVSREIVLADLAQMQTQAKQEVEQRAKVSLDLCHLGLS